MSDLNLNSPTGIIYIVLIIVACLVGLWGLNKLKGGYNSVAFRSFNERREAAGRLPVEKQSTGGGERHRVKRPRK